MDSSSYVEKFPAAALSTDALFPLNLTLGTQLCTLNWLYQLELKQTLLFRLSFLLIHFHNTITTFYPDHKGIQVLQAAPCTILSSACLLCLHTYSPYLVCSIVYLSFSSLALYCYREAPRNGR